MHQQLPACQVVGDIDAHFDDAGKITALFEPMAYQGAAQALIDRLLASLNNK